MDEDEKTRVTDLVSTGAGTAVSVAAAVHPAFAWAAPIIQGAFTLAGTRINASRKARLGKALAEKITDLPKEYVEKRVQEEGFQDLLEEAAFQILRPVSQERIEQIASVLKNGLSDEDKHTENYKFLLGLLGQLNDAEVISLKALSFMDNNEQAAFYEKHQNVLMPPQAYMGSSQSELDASTMHKTRRDHLKQLGLARDHFSTPRKGEMPAFDTNTGCMKVSRTDISPLGRLLLRAIDQAPQEEDEGEASGDA